MKSTSLIDFGPSRLAYKGQQGIGLVRSNVFILLYKKFRRVMKLWDRTEVSKLIYAVLKSLSSVGLFPPFRTLSRREKDEYLYVLVNERSGEEIGLLVSTRPLTYRQIPIEELERRVGEVRKLFITDKDYEPKELSYVYALRVVTELLESAFVEGKVIPLYKLDKEKHYFLIKVFETPSAFPYPDKAKIAAMFKVPEDVDLEDIVPGDHLLRSLALVYYRRRDIYEKHICPKLGEACEAQKKILEIFVSTERRELGKSIVDVYSNL